MTCLRLHARWTIPTVPATEHNTDMLINNALMGGESEVAMSWSRRLAQYPTLLPTGAYGDASADWTHLPLVQVGNVTSHTAWRMPTPTDA